MARYEADREDLFAEATALVRRMEFTLPGRPEPIVAGFRRDGSLSVYLGADPVFHFDPAGRLKRAYADGKLYRTQGDTLAELTRERTETETILRRRDLDAVETSRIFVLMRARLIDPVLAIDAGLVEGLRLFPPEDSQLPGDFVAFVQPILGTRDEHLLAPRFKGKR